MYLLCGELYIHISNFIIIAKHKFFEIFFIEYRKNIHKIDYIVLRNKKCNSLRFSFEGLGFVPLIKNNQIDIFLEDKSKMI